MKIWLLAFALYLLWAILKLIGKGGFIHILLLCAIAISVVQLTARYRAAQG